MQILDQLYRSSIEIINHDSIRIIGLTRRREKNHRLLWRVRVMNSFESHGHLKAWVKSMNDPTITVSEARKHTDEGFHNIVKCVQYHMMLLKRKVASDFITYLHIIKSGKTDNFSLGIIPAIYQILINHHGKPCKIGQSLTIAFPFYKPRTVCRNIRDSCIRTHDAKDSITKDLIRPYSKGKRL
jgi:hypothetical protein